ncbi:hypothetical protein HK096_006056 [Nowakowskiella sp. JEL0078]|nr:hypothetical protein HK096_006056 [Nowakowskiella sp. JEL0078]
MKFTTLSAVALSVFQLALAAPLEPRRFGQEQAVSLGSKISAVSSGCPSNGDGSLGFSGSEIKFLLAAADPCGKLTLADQVALQRKLIQLIIAIAMQLVAAEKNFNPFATLLDSVCLKAGLPASIELQGILQKVDPRTTAPNNNDAALQTRAAVLNAKAESVLTAAQATGKGPGSGGKSMAQLLADNGFTDIQGFSGTGSTATTAAAVADVTTATTTTIAASTSTTTAAAITASSLGSCSASAAQLVAKLGADPDKANEVRFIPGGFKTDPIFGGQSSALNGGIIANFICDRLADQCKAPASTVTACRATQLIVNGNKGGSNLSDTQVAALEKIASNFNAAIGIGSTVVAADVRTSAVSENTTTTTAGADATVTTDVTDATTTSNVDIPALISLLQKAVDLLNA